MKTAKYLKIVTIFSLVGILISCSNDDNDTQQAKQPSTEASMSKTAETVSPPVAQKIDHILKIHDESRNDPYYWLRDDTRENKQVLAYLDAENQYTKQQLAHTNDLQEKLFQEMTARLEPNKTSVPTLDKGYWYWSKYESGKDYRLHIRQKGNLEAPEERLLDQNNRATGHEYYHLGDMEISPDQSMLAISEDIVSRRLYEIRIKNIATGEYFPEVIENASGSIVWANDNKTLFYVKKNLETLLPYQVYRHKLGTPQTLDIMVFEEKDNTFYTSIFKTRSDKFIGIHVDSTMNSETRFIAADSPESDFSLFLARETDHKYQVEHIGQYFYVLTDLDAPNQRMLKVPEDQIGDKNHWQEIISHKNDTLLQNFELFNDFILISERINGLEKLRLRDYKGQLIQEIQFAEAAYSVYIGNNPDPASDSVRYHYQSMTTPSSVYQYHTASQNSQLLKQDKVLGNFHPDNYLSERIMIDARDGQKIPVSIVYRKDTFSKNGQNPILHYAYGSYGYTIDPTFSVSRLSLLDRGFVFAISHIRGSKMLGRQWYEDGKKLNKLNTFTDFNDATKALVKLGYADRKKVYAMGGSAGGLLMGAVINMAPELYHGVVAAVPFVDVITTMLDESIPLTTGEYDEWGNPNQKDYYDYMLAYSPYDQVKKQDYPNLLVTTGLHDSQVQYWEPAKWVAKLRNLKTDSNILLLDTDMEVGHGGKSGRYNAYHDAAKKYAFILDLAGIKE